jgi:hypothetical protein
MRKRPSAKLRYENDKKAVSRAVSQVSERVFEFSPPRGGYYTKRTVYFFSSVSQHNSFPTRMHAETRNPLK